MPIKDSDSVAFPSDEAKVSPFDLPQNNTILPREASIPGTMTGKGTINLGGINGIYIDGSQGMYAGSENFNTANWSVDFQGHMVATRATIQTSATGNRIVIDPDTNSITIYDEFNDQVGFLYGNTGKLILAQNQSGSAGGMVVDGIAQETVISSPIKPGSQVILNASDDSFNSSVIIVSPTSITFTPDPGGSIGFFGVGPAIQQTGGVASAGGAYGATEQGMLNRSYQALRNYGLLT